MPVHIDVKYRVPARDVVLEALHRLPAREAEPLHQRDTYFHTVSGHLKLREEGGEAALILYDRPDEPTSRVCDYVRIPVGDAAAIKVRLGAALGVRAVVEKRRRVFVYGPSRIHLDRVRRLGTIVEVETEVRRDREAAWGEHRTLIEKLELAESGKPVAGSYADLV